MTIGFLSNESWDLEPQDHFDRAEALLDRMPVAGEPVGPALGYIYAANRHATLGAIKMGVEMLALKEELEAELKRLKKL